MAVLWIRILTRMDSHQIERLDLDLDPRQSDKLDTDLDPHQFADDKPKCK
jgi:hypothetical protein